MPTFSFKKRRAQSTWRILQAGCLMLWMFSMSACSHWHPALVAEREISFNSFIGSTKSASMKDFSNVRGVRVENESALAEMKNHILLLYQGITPTHTFLGRDNQFVDCVPIEQQPGLRNPDFRPISLVREAPIVSVEPLSEKAEKADLLSKERRPADITLKPGIKDRFEKEMYCETNTIPLRRITLEEMTRFRTLEDFLGKRDRIDQRETRGDMGGTDLVPGDPSHYYAVGSQAVSNFGGDSWLNVWSPRVSTHQMSLSQMWVRGNPDDSKQTIEAGWQVFPDKWSSTQAALFIYYTTNGYKKGSGCYNLDCSGFVQIANNVYLGAGFDHYSERGGGQWGFNLQIKRHTDGNWWLFYRGAGNYIAVGYYPGALYGNGELARQASIIRWGGEDTGDPTACQMGSGAFPSEGWGRAAYHDVVFYIDPNTVSQWANLSKVETPPDCYLIDIHNASSNGQKTFFYFGGPKCK